MIEIMGLKFRRRQKIFPGFYVNFSAKGISTTMGIKGFNVNINKDGAYLNTGIPGTGIYDRKKISDWNSNKSTPEKSFNESFKNENYFLPENLRGEIKSKNASEVTTQGLVELKETLVAANKEMAAIKKEISQLEKKVQNSNILRIFSKVFLIGFLIKWFDNDYSEKKEYLANLKKQVAECHIDIEIHMDRVLDEKYLKLKLAFDNLLKSSIIWDMTSAVPNEDNRSSANRSIERKPTKISYQKIPFLNSVYEAMCFQNQNGSNIYIYPGFAALFDNKDNFGLIELDELDITYGPMNFLETEKIPNDSKIVGETWAKVNKDGTPDRRFKNNYKIPIARYGELTFKSNSGVFEVFLSSNEKYSEEFAERYNQYVE
ncbi:DUF4236 domain-containing protein [Maribacter thermophilus]|uniref:DUF4236 domain-containing protein n=1 Tax=Maribacter thermophilus TaxID=1197874 RepID=UPI00064104B9|nr:DUF4236 domain-containing protein [Maribacter thermophilus]